MRSNRTPENYLDGLLAHRSLTAFRRKIARDGEFQRPEWAAPQYAQEILPLLLVGTWDDQNERDKSCLEVITNLKYADISSNATRWLNEIDSPLRRIDNM